MKVSQKKSYTLADMIREEVFPWAPSSSARTTRRYYTQIVSDDFKGSNELGSTITGFGRMIEYLIPRNNITKFVRKYGKGLSLAANKQHGNQDQDRVR